MAEGAEPGVTTAGDTTAEGIEATTARALSQRLAVEQAERRLPSVAAGLVRGGVLV